jgi:fatty acid desaturase
MAATTDPQSNTAVDSAPSVVAGQTSGKKRSMLPTILLALAAIVAVLAVVVATRPAEFRVSRSAMIPAPPADVFAHVNDLHHWEAWSPWAKLDPQAKGTTTVRAPGRALRSPGRATVKSAKGG